MVTNETAAVPQNITGKPERNYYLDNIRWLVIALVFIHHLCYMFNSEGLRGHFWAKGIPAMDIFSHIVYPWFMGILFVVAGIGVKYSLKRRTIEEFKKERFAKLMRPFIFGMLIMSPVVAYHMFETQGTLDKVYAGMGNVPMAAKYAELWIMCFLIGMAQLWFIFELFISSKILLFIIKKDKNHKLDAIGEKCCEDGKNGIISLVIIGVLYIVLAKSVDLMCSVNYIIMGLWIVLRPQLYFYLFMLGYYVFSNDKMLGKLKKAALPLAGAAVILCAIQIIYSFGGDNTASNGMFDYTISCNFILPSLFAFVAIIAIFGCAGRWFNQYNKFTSYMNGRSFGFYMFHYIVMVYAADFAVNYLKLDGMARYAVTFLLSVIGTVLVTEIIRLTPGVSTLFGIKRLQKKVLPETTNI